MTKYSKILYIFSLVAIIGLTSCSSPEEKRNNFLESGQKFEQSGDLIKARLEYKNAVQVDPKCVECLKRLGNVELELKNFRDAYAAFVKASELDPDNLEIKIDIAKILVMGRAGKKAEEIAREILEKAPDNFDATVILAISLAMQKDKKQEAYREFEKVRSSYPDKPEGYALAARLLASEKKYQEALRLLEAGIKKVQEKSALYQTFIGIYAANGDWDKAIHYAELYYQSVPGANTSVASYLTLAQLYAKKGDLKNAEKQWEKAIKAAPDNTDILIRYAQFLAGNKKIEQAEKFLRERLNKKDDIKLRVALAKLLAGTRRGDEALELLKAGYSDSLEKPQRIALLDEEASINLGLGRMDKALKITEEVLKENPNDLTALNIQAKIALLEKDGEQAVSILRRLVEEEPDNITFQMLLAQAHAVNGEFKLAEDQLRRTIKKHPDNQNLWIALTKLKLAQKDLASASGVVSEAMGHIPNSAALYNLNGMLQWKAGDIKGAEKNFRKAMELQPEWLIPYRNLASLKLQAGDPAEAEKTFKEAAKLYPDAPGPQILLASLYEQTGKPEKAIEIYENLIKKHPDSAILLNNLAFLIADSAPARIEEARTLINKALKGLNNPPPTFLDTLAWIEYRSGNSEKAIELINQALAAAPDNPTLLYHQAVLLKESGRNSAALEAIKKALEQPVPFPEKNKAIELRQQLQEIAAS